ncbi:MAG: hypothetical protein AB1757_12655 [Acidobacteriota bacterium]
MTWLPDNKYFWDFWFAERAGNLHLFYLQASKPQCGYNPDLRHNLSSIGQATLTPHGWRDEGTVFTASENHAWDNLSIWTGSIIEHPTNGWFYLFYTARGKQDARRWTPAEWQRAQQIGIAQSSDLRSWERIAESKIQPAIRNPGVGKFDGVAWRDPFVIFENRKFFAFICARLNPESDPAAYQARTMIDAGGAIAFLESPDIENWHDGEPQILVASDEFYQLEVPQVFWRRFENGKRFYLIFCAQEKDCSRARRERYPLSECQTGTYYMRSPLLPFDFQGIPALESPAKLFAKGLYAGKLLHPETENHPTFFGFVWSDASGHFVGGLSDPLKTIFHDDGSLKLVSG